MNRSVPWGSRVRLLFFFIFVSGVGLSCPSLTWGARPAEVDKDKVRVHENPHKMSRVLETLSRSTVIAVSNVPTEGFHKVRTPSGKIGWVIAEELALGPIPSPEAIARSPQSETKRYAEKWVRVRGLGGLDFFSLTTPIPSFQISLGYHFGGEIEYRLSPSWGIVLRVEQIVKTVGLTDSNTGKIFSLSLGSTPAMVGLDWVMIQGTNTSIRLGLFAGIGLQTYFRSTNLTDVPPPDNVATLASTPITAMAKVEFNWQILPWLGAFCEGGFRYLQTPEMTTPSGNGALILNPSFSLVLTSPFVGAGLGLSF